MGYQSASGSVKSVGLERWSGDSSRFSEGRGLGKRWEKFLLFKLPGFGEGVGLGDGCTPMAATGKRTIAVPRCIWWPISIAKSFGQGGVPDAHDGLPANTVLPG